MFNQGETVLIELENGYRWEAEIVEHCFDDKPYQDYNSEYLILEAETHPARNQTGRMTYQLNNGRVEAGTMYSPCNNKKHESCTLWTKQQRNG